MEDAGTNEHRHVRAPPRVVRERQRVEDVRDEVVSTDIAHMIKGRRGLDEAAQRPRGRVPERGVVVPHDRTEGVDHGRGRGARVVSLMTEERRPGVTRRQVGARAGRRVVVRRVVDRILVALE